MTNEAIRFDDGAAYERYMGVWSRLAGDVFLEWLDPRPGLRWLDVGCGNGAFTERIVQRGQPGSVSGVDPAEGQLEFARSRPALRGVEFQRAGAEELPFDNDAFDAAVMPLVIFFVPDPAKGVTEMARVVKAGGLVAAYAWDMPGGGFPYESLRAELIARGVAVPTAPSPEASRTEVMRELWEGAGMTGVETREIAVERTFSDFEDYWQTVLGAPSMGSKLAAMSAGDRDALRARMRELLPAGAHGKITCRGRANAVKGRVSP